MPNRTWSDAERSWRAVSKMRTIRITERVAEECWRLSDAAFRTHIEGSLESARHDLVGRVDKGFEDRRFWTADPLSAIAELITAGFWQDRGDHYQIVHASVVIPKPADLARLAKMNADQQASKEPNRLELAGYAILDAIGVPYERQVVFEGKFTPDATIHSAKLIVQFDGEYWHDRAGTSRNPARIRQVTRDRSQDAYIRACGWEVIRFWESDVHHDPDLCAVQLKELLRERLA